MSAMMARTGTDAEACALAGVGFESAVRRCLWCSRSQTCRDWLAFTEGTSQVAPAFCPNAEFFAHAPRSSVG